MSDTHGFYDEMVTVLQRSNLLGEDKKWIAGDITQLVHLGDFVDRGPRSTDTFNFFRDLQNDLEKGQVIRLVGNHEFCYCGGPEFGGMELEGRTLGPLMQQDIIEGKLQFAYALETESDSHLVVHAGLDPSWKDYNKMELIPLVDKLNAIGQEFSSKYKDHSIQNLRNGTYVECPPILGGVSYSRGGWSINPGITWADYYEDLREKESFMKHKQIVGHSIQHNGITLSPKKNIWAINVPYGSAQILNYFRDSNLFIPSDLVNLADTTNYL